MRSSVKKWSGQMWLARFVILPLIVSLQLGLATPGRAWGGEQAVAPGKPNILFVFADDQCFETIRALGNDEIETPHLDSLVRRGTTYTHCFNMGSWSGAVCVASRTMLNTGRYLWRAEQVYGTSERERSEGRFWSELMRDAGYRTYMTGKWHVRANAEKAFDVVADVRGGMPTQTEAGYDRPAADGSDPWSPSDPKFGGFWQGGKHWSEVVGDHATRFLRQAAEQQDPFFMYIAFNAPHDPRQAPEEFVDRYPLEQIRVPESYLPRYPYAREIGCGPGLRDEKLAPFPRTEHAVKVHRQEYYAIITHMDQQIGRVMEALEASGKAENTWIFFTADHGLAVGHHGFMGKQNLYDHSVRVPFVAIGPGVAEGRELDRPIYLQDVMPTTLELAGVDKPEYVEFESLVGELRGQENAAKSAGSAGLSGADARAIYGAYLDLQRSIRTGAHKLIVYPKAKKVRLYDLAADPEEMHDLADDGESQVLIKQLFEQLIELQEKMDDGLDLRPLFAEL